MNLHKFRYIRIGIETPIYVILLGMTAIQIALPWRITNLVSLGTWGIFISTLAAFSLRIRRYDRDTLTVLILVVMVMLSMFGALTLSYRGWVAALNFLEIPMFISAYPYVRSKNIRRTIYTCFSLLSIYYVFLYFTSISNIYYTEYGVRQVHALTLGYNNPNETAMYLFATIIVLTSLLKESNKLLTKLFAAIVIITIVYLVWLTLSRTSLILCLVYLFSVFFFKKKRIPSFFRRAAFYVPIVFFIGNIVFRDIIERWNVLGETMDTGRADIYMRLLGQLDIRTFLIGDFQRYFENFHNAFLSIFSTIGILGVGVYVNFLYLKFRDLHNQLMENSTGKVALLGVFCVLLYMSTESSFLVGGGTFAAMFVAIYLLSTNVEPIISREKKDDSAR